ncbi:sn-glycerol-1-phosphate dehydrogenase [Dictyoglomus thermophilum]|uniref:3-dehydroquinate synthase n=1 Tax=Dictyoglomus thermophilum (strain ATCC 35947 / DSM 3960 / H-6-12) TaxID=309799 RepID=B5YAI4_DICT6|nr:sn-glycerol-1-phosphate dehydrogenase [Dictyoglomus thermophilum]ACI18892.1 3-dehydroquinate synthase [Dictyoglomus thermophilum H-6-12]
MLVWDSSYSNLIEYIKNQKEKPFLLVDENTYKVAGREIESQLKKLNIDYDLLILPGDAHADEKHICKVMLHVNSNHMMVSIGSGSLTDIARFISYKMNLRFLSVPTAPSMDGYASSVAALTIDNIKTTVIAKTPEKIFARIDVIKDAPEILKKAGFGDLIGKYTALSDWKLANILTDEPINEKVYNEMYEACENTLKSINKPDFEKLLLEALIKSGELMAIVGNSRPASGAEHHIAHYLEFLGYDIFHGIKVGISTLYVIKLYEKLFEIDLDNTNQYLDYEVDIEPWKEEIKVNFPQISERIIKENLERMKEFNNPSFRRAFLEKIKLNKNKIYLIAEKLLNKKEEIIRAYNELGFSTNPQDWNIKEEDIKKAIQYALYIRDRFTILTLYQFLGVLKNLSNDV